MKKIRISDISAAVEKFAPVSTQAEWDNSGFSVGDPDSEAKGVMIALDCTEDVINEAFEVGCNMVLTHHPLIFGGCSNVLHSTLQGRAIETAIRKGVTVYSCHTPLDKAKGGLNDLMAQRLGLAECTVLSENGFGAIGNLKVPMKGEKFAEFVKKRFGTADLRCSDPRGRVIRRVAVSSGAGKDSVEDAIAKGAQALVTGDVTHHTFYVPDGFMVLDAGHYESEWAAVALLESIVKKNFPKFATHLSKTDKSPIYHF